LATAETRAVRAQAKWVRTSARKARLVAEHIRGLPVADARAVLAFTPRAAARDMEKVLRSAVANAEANHGLYGEDLVVVAAFVDEGPTLKRWRARARGRVARIRKRTCHITVVLEQSPEALKKRAETSKTRRPSVRRTKTETPAEGVKPAETATPAGEPQVVEAAAEAPAEAAAPEAAGPAAEAPATEEQPKPKRRTPVRRKKTEEKES
jgi:ribosomal protein L22